MRRFGRCWSPRPIHYVLRVDPIGRVFEWTVPDDITIPLYMRIRQKMAALIRHAGGLHGELFARFHDGGVLPLASKDI